MKTLDNGAGKTSDRTTAPLAHRLRDALQMLGGEAHRGLVIEQVARELGHDVRYVPEDLQQALIQSFEQALRDKRKRTTYGFHLPFGEGSHRWGLRREVMAH